jgi:hypothetical protein
MQLAVAAVLLAALAVALLARPAAVCTERMLRAALVCGMPGCAAGVLGTLAGTPAGLAVGLPGGLAAAASLWALRAPVVDAADDTGPDDEDGGGGGGPRPPDDGPGTDPRDPPGEGIDWEDFERRAYEAFEAHISASP